MPLEPCPTLIALDQVTERLNDLVLDVAEFLALPLILFSPASRAGVLEVVLLVPRDDRRVDDVVEPSPLLTVIEAEIGILGLGWPEDLR